MNELHFGDNIDVLRAMDAESVNLIYLDPPFNSRRNYNIIYTSPDGEDSPAQLTAFRDSWYWGEQAEREYHDLLRGDNSSLSKMIISFRDFLGENDMMAYLVMMGIRLLELYRVLKPNGSLYLHCDPTASHYLKILLDNIFGKECFKNEIVWKRTPFSGSSKSRAKQFPKNHDIIFFYTKLQTGTWNPPTVPYSSEYLKRFKWSDERGFYRKTLLKTYSQETLQRLKNENRLIEPVKKGANYSYKQYLSESKGTKLIDDVWVDINMLNPVSKERLGYPTQKPLALLERIILASSEEGDIILDPFCGCGTAVHAAHKLNRRWIGIDITHLAISVIEKRLKDAFPNIEFNVKGRPEDLAGAQNLASRDKYEFEAWARDLVGARPGGNARKGADGGVDGLIYFSDVQGTKRKDGKIIVSVKGGQNIGLVMLKELIATVQSNKADMGLFVTLKEPTKPMKTEALTAGYYTAGNGKTYPKIQILTIEGLLNGTERPEYYDMSMGQLTHKKSKREQEEAGQKLLPLAVPIPKKPRGKSKIAAEKTKSSTVTKGKKSTRKK